MSWILGAAPRDVDWEGAIWAARRAPDIAVRGSLLVSRGPQAPPVRAAHWHGTSAGARMTGLPVAAGVSRLLNALCLFYSLGQTRAQHYSFACACAYRRLRRLPVTRVGHQTQPQAPTRLCAVPLRLRPKHAAAPLPTLVTCSGRCHGSCTPVTNTDGIVRGWGNFFAPGVNQQSGCMLVDPLSAATEICMHTAEVTAEEAALSELLSSANTLPYSSLALGDLVNGRELETSMHIQYDTVQCSAVQCSLDGTGPFL